MKCPLFVMGAYAYSGKEALVPPDCCKEECAWWDVEMGQCSINSLKSNLENIVLRLRDIVKELTLVRGR